MDAYRVTPPQKENFVINHLTPCRSKPVKASFVFGTQFKIFWMKTGRFVTVPLTAKQLTLSKPTRILFVRYSVSAAPHGYVFYVYLRFDLNENSISVWCGWHRTAYAVASSGYSLKWHYAEPETNCWIKSLFLFPLRTKSILLVASLNSDWTTDGRWIILTMSFILFWALTVLFTLQSMGQSQASRFSSKFSVWGGVTL